MYGLCDWIDAVEAKERNMKMPCRTDYYDEPIRTSETKKLKNRVAFLESSLCAVLTAAEKGFVLSTMWKNIDFKEAGITAADLETFWNVHKAKDEARRAKEAEMIQARAAANKLTEEELKLLQKYPEMLKG